MANLDARFFTTSDLDTYYVDNSSGLPMSGGIITFYSDINRTSLKPVYQLTGTPGNYTYSPLNNPITLSSAGTIQDGLGNNIVPYYYPFTGTPEENTGVQELYYVVCVNSGFVPQFVRQGWPQAASSSPVPVSDNQIDNFIPNGQFLAHTTPTSITEPPIIQITINSTTVDMQPIAQGGWFFAYTDATTATFNNGFSQIPASGGWGAANFPKYLFNFNCTGIGNTPSTRDLWITWPDINKFSSAPTPYTLYFDARSNDGNAYTFTLYGIYYFGTGGAPSASFYSSPIATFTIGPSATLIAHNITDISWLVNQGTIGTNGDDFVGLAMRGPASGWNVSMSDFLLVQGNETFTSFPIETNDQMLSRGVTGFMPTPDPDGNDLYLPLVLTPQGMTWDASVVGTITAKTQLVANPDFNELAFDGSSYVTYNYQASGSRTLNTSALGIPYIRLRDYLLANSAAVSVTNGTTTSTIPANYIPMYGTGPNFVTVLQSATAGKFDLSFNTASGGNAVNNQTSGFTHTSADPLYVFTVPGVPTAGQYFSFTVGLTGLVYNAWFTVDNVGAPPPAPSGSNILVQITSSATIANVIGAIISAVNGYQFFLPNLAGYFLRGLDTGTSVDPDSASRTVPGIADNGNAWTGAHLASIESGAFASHTHAAASGNFFLATAGGLSLPAAGANAASVNLTAATGGNETRPVNFAVNYFIRY